ncbi:Hypothetical protein CINCED_3A001540 [Cinara cedri]|uniref:Uncharacterized protein n=1 Tax=Cinara cedri TaxID=506608 RepID=A0A5E4NLG1_9HEMI|nr:Hypothetical protein CINCED_3A001540 [Cinara cedri]
MANIKLKDENQMLKDEMETLKNELKKAKTRIKVFENEIMTVIGQKDDLQQKYDKLRSESDELEKAQNQTIAKLRHELKTEKAKLKITENNQQKFSKELQSKLEEKDSVIIQKELALGDLSSQISILKSELEWP